MLQAFIVVAHIVPEARLHRPNIRGEFGIHAIIDASRRYNENDEGINSAAIRLIHRPVIFAYIFSHRFTYSNFQNIPNDIEAI